MNKDKRELTSGKQQDDYKHSMVLQSLLDTFYTETKPETTYRRSRTHNTTLVYSLKPATDRLLSPHLSLLPIRVLIQLASRWGTGLELNIIEP